jgi:DNA-binding NarL/FixJ family response regulator
VIRVLIVDDHEITRTGLRAILGSGPSFDVVGELGSADQLESVVKETLPDVVLLDARLPGVSGAEACRRLQESHPAVAVLVISAFDDADLVEQFIDSGARGYLVKDIERFALKASIRAVVRGESAISPSVAVGVLERARRQGEAKPPLSEGHLEILRLVSEGLSNRQIAVRVHLSEHTVKSHLQEVFRRLNARSRAEAALRANREGWI